MGSKKKTSTYQKEIIVKASPTMVWEMLSTSQGYQRFFNRHTKLDFCEGGKATFAVSDTFSYDAHFTKIIPYQYIAWEERYEHGNVLVEWTIEPSDKDQEQTTIRMVSSGFIDGDTFNEGVDWGWETSLRCLQWSLESDFHRHHHPYLGLQGGMIGMGFQIYEVQENSPAYKVGINPGDRILGIESHSLCGIGWMADVLHHYHRKQKLTLRVVRKGDWLPEEVQLTPEHRYLEMGEQDVV